MSQTTGKHRELELDLAQRMAQDRYINEQGYTVFTERFHLKRGTCCGNGCRHCPFEPRHQKDERVLNKSVGAFLKKNL